MYLETNRIQATVPIIWLRAMEESLGVSLSYNVRIPFYLFAFFPAVARIKHKSYVVLIKSYDSVGSLPF